MVFHENRLLADDSHEISRLICFCFFLKKRENLKFRLLQIIGGALWV